MIGQGISFLIYKQARDYLGVVTQSEVHHANEVWAKAKHEKTFLQPLRKMKLDLMNGILDVKIEEFINLVRLQLDHLQEK